MSPRILVVRNDKLGDFMLAFPALALLKRSVPDAAVHVLVPGYTRPMAELCEWVDGIVEDADPKGGLRSALTLARSLREGHYDAVIALFSTTRVGLAARLARIPYRLAPATKLAQVFFNHRLVQRRSRSEKPEFAYNMDLVRRYCADHGIDPADDGGPPYLRLQPVQREAFCRRLGIGPDAAIVFLHPGSGGSANNLSVEQYAALARGLRSHRGHHIVITAGPGEAEIARRVAAGLEGIPHTVLESTEGLRRFAQHIAIADVFISGSTGPLHIAGALDRPTAAFYPRKRSSTALRWQTINREANRLAFRPMPPAEESDMESIDVGAAARAISERYLGGRAVCIAGEGGGLECP